MKARFVELFKSEKDNMSLLHMRIFKFFSLLAISFALCACATRGIQYRMNGQKEAFCSPQREHYKFRKTTPIKYFLDPHVFHPSYWRKRDKNFLIHQLSLHNMEYIQYRDIMTVIIPVDQYFEIDSSQLNERHYSGLNNLVNLIYLSPCTTVHVGAFADNVGTREYNNRLTQAQAEAILTYLWANGIPADHLNAQGFGKRFAIADNRTTRGSAMNRRIEVQWTTRADETLTDAVNLSMK